MEIAKSWTVPHFLKEWGNYWEHIVKKKTEELERSLHKWNMLVAMKNYLQRNGPSTNPEKVKKAAKVSLLGKTKKWTHNEWKLFSRASADK